MSDKTGIEWTDATWNPIRGCSRVSEGCKNCYAERVAARFSKGKEAYAGTITDGRWNGQIRVVDDAMEQPLRWKRPRRIFVNSMSDLFHENIPQDVVPKVFRIMRAAKQHHFQVLTKRPERMRNLVTGIWGDDPAPNVWLGVSVENQRTADERIPLLLQTPAAVRFLSCEPLLGQVNLIPFLKQIACDDCTQGVMDKENPHLFGRCDCSCHDGLGRLHWVIVGGESGTGARPMQTEWARQLRDQCQAAGVAFFFKQWGEWLGGYQDGDHDHDPIELNCTPDPVRAGKKAAGRMLDCRTWDEFPVTQRRNP